MYGARSLSQDLLVYTLLQRAPYETGISFNVKGVLRYASWLQTWFWHSPYLQYRRGLRLGLLLCVTVSVSVLKKHSSSVTVVTFFSTLLNTSPINIYLFSFDWCSGFKAKKKFKTPQKNRTKANSRTWGYVSRFEQSELLITSLSRFDPLSNNLVNKNSPIILIQRKAEPRCVYFRLT